MKGRKEEMNMKPFEDKVWLSSPTMHGDELKYVTEAYETNWMSTVGKNITEAERMIAELVGVRYAVALSAGTAALHLAMKLAGEAMYGQAELGKGALSNRKVFCSDVTFDATVNPVVYEGGKSCPTEILETLAKYNAEGRPVWKPMHMQPIYRMNPYITREGSGRARTNAYIEGGCADVGMDIFERGLCLPSDNKMTAEQQARIIEIIRSCFGEDVP